MAGIVSRRGMLYINYWVTDSLTGQKKRISRSLGLKDSKENRRIAKLIKTEKEAELLRPNNYVITYANTLKSAFAEFLHSKNNSAKKTIVMYRLAYEKLLLVVEPERKVTKITDRDFIELEILLKSPEYNLSENSISTYFRQLKTFWNWMVKKGYVPKQIVPIRKQKEKPIESIPRRDFEIILEFFKSKDINQYRFIKFLELTGFRKREAVNLEWENIDFTNKRIILRNTKARRIEEFPLYEVLEEFLLEFRKPSGKIFPYKSGDSLKFWWRGMKKLKMHYTIHQIRKSFATKLVNENISMFDAMKLLRHKSVQTTLKYYASADLSRIGSEVNILFKA